MQACPLCTEMDILDNDADGFNQLSEVIKSPSYHLRR